MIVQDIGDPQVIVGYSAGAEAALMYASSHPSVDTIILLGPTFTGGDVLEGDDIGFEGWSKYMEQVLANGTNIIIVDDDFTADRELNLWAQNAEANLEDAGIPPGTALLYLYRPLTPHYDEGRIKTGSNNNPRIRDGLFEWVDYFPE
jgi:pimeloyl-ACP methyl ester carboxylesterase